MVQKWYTITVEDELEKNPQLTREDIQTVRQWLTSQPHLPQQIPDVDLAIFLQACQFDVEFAQKTIEINYTVRSNALFFQNRDPAGKELLISQSCTDLVVMETRDEELNAFLIGALSNYDVALYKPLEYIKQMFMLGDMAKLVMGSSNTVTIIMDVKGISFRHLLKAPLRQMKNLFTYIQDGSPVRLKEIHILNTQGSLIDTIMSFMKPFMSQKLIDMCIFHPGYESLHYYINPQHLPEDYGGTAGKLHDLAVKQNQQLIECMEYFKDEEDLRIDESKRKTSKYFWQF